MPKIFADRRRFLFLQLACLGVVQALLAIIMSLSVNAVITGATHLGALLIVSAVGLGIAQWVHRVVTEDLGQDYVHEVRRKLVAAALSPEHSASLGVTITRASNDLSAVRNWVALGIVPLVSGVPLIAVVLGALFFQESRAGFAALMPLALCLTALPVLARWTLHKARNLRRKRGRMAARIADSVQAGEGLRAAGGVFREVSAVSRDSDRVVLAAVERSWATGLTRALMAMAASLSMVSVVIFGQLEASAVAGTMMLLGVLAAPVAELGRVVEYRQNYRAALLILKPILTRGADFIRQQEQAPAIEDIPGVQGVFIKGIAAQAGERIHLHGSAEATRAWIASLTENDGTAPDDAIVNGHRLGQLSLKQRRTFLGIASDHHHLSRGSVARLVGLRVPDAEPEEISAALRRVGMEPEEKVLKQKLKNGGQPWSLSQINQLKLASAALRTPPLLVVEGIDPTPVQNYPGVIISTKASPGERWRTVNI